MLIHPTVDRLRALGLAAMADTVVELQNNPEAAGMPHGDWPGLLVDREVTARDNRRLTRRLTSAKLRQVAAIENVDYRTAWSRPFAFPDPCHLPMDPRCQPSGHCRPNRHRQVLACLRARQQGLPRRLFRPLQMTGAISMASGAGFRKRTD
jgi:hypothetical protein